MTKEIDPAHALVGRINEHLARPDGVVEVMCQGSLEWMKIKTCDRFATTIGLRLDNKKYVGIKPHHNPALDTFALRFRTETL